MLAGAIQQYLRRAGLSPVYVGGFGDYTTAGAPAWNVSVESDDFAELDGATYNARLQIRSRAANIIAAENAGRTAFDAVRAMDGEDLPWDDPTGGPDRTYRVEAIRVVNHPTWYATPEMGEETAANLRLFVTELN